MKKHLPLSGTNCLANQPHITPLSASDMDQIIGGFQVEANESHLPSFPSASLQSPLGSHSLFMPHTPPLHR